MTLRFYATARLGEHQSLTPEGFLLVQSVPVARVGEMIYGPGETPVSIGGDGLVRITRDDGELFRAETLASCNGKPMVDDHPDSDVTPGNWRKLAVGSMLNPRRGDGEQADFLLVDLLVQDEDAITAVRNGKRQLSLGYDASYHEIEPGRGVQSEIVINHVALVEKARCGPRCAIGDKESVETKKEGPPMASMTQKERAAKLRKAFNTRDMEAFEEHLGALESEEATGAPATAETKGGGEHHIHIYPHGAALEGKNVRAEGEDDGAGEGAEAQGGGSETGGDDRVAALEARVESIEGLLQEILEAFSGDDDQAEGSEETATDSGGDATEGDEDASDQTEGDDKEAQTGDNAEALGNTDPAKGQGGVQDKARDSANLRDEFQETLSLAEILAPGIRLPTFDTASPAKTTSDAICGLRRKALDKAYSGDGRGIVSQVMGGKALDTKSMTCDAIAVVFNAAGALARVANNSRSAASQTGAGNTAGGPRTPAEFNRFMRERRATGKV